VGVMAPVTMVVLELGILAMLGWIYWRSRR
jgi:hypothetical protein